MLTWISDTIFRVFSWVPNWLYADDTPRYFIVRAMLGLLLIVVVFWPSQRGIPGVVSAEKAPPINAAVGRLSNGV